MLKIPEAKLSIFKSLDYVQVSNFPYLGKLCAGIRFMRKVTSEGVTWVESDGDKIFNEVTDKKTISKLEKLWEINMKTLFLF